MATVTLLGCSAKYTKCHKVKQHNGSRTNSVYPPGKLMNTTKFLRKHEFKLKRVDSAKASLLNQYQHDKARLILGLRIAINRINYQFHHRAAVDHPIGIVGSAVF